MNARSKIRQFLVKNFNSMNPDFSLADSDNIFELGFVNSLFALSLLGYIEKEFSFTISDEDISIKNFTSVDNIMKLVNKYQQVPVE
jgi:methoxymalonate biosynthesis acyl carrier protein